jgi:dTDP-4-dehydrorhamnose reductase
MAKRILVVGGSSFLGRRLLARLGPARALGTYCRAPIPDGVQFDALTMDLDAVLTAPEEFSHAVLLLGNTRIVSCAEDPERSEQLNVAALQRLIRRLAQRGITPVFTSSDAVFDGAKGGYTEEDAPNPVVTYGRQKLAVERFLAEQGPPHLIVRLTKLAGTERGDGSLFTAWLDQIERGETIRCAYDQRLSPIDVEDAVEAICRLIESDAQGVFHAGGPRAYSRLDLLQLLLSRVRVPAKVVPCRLRDVPLPETPPLDVSLNSEKLMRTTGLRPHRIETICRIIGGHAAATI